MPDSPDDANPKPPPADPSRLKQARVRLMLLAIGLAVVYAVFNVLMSSEKRYTSLLFIGLPAILAIVVTLTPPAKSTQGAVAKAITLMFLLTGIFAIEGFICILVSAPLFYAVGAAVAAVIDFFRNRKRRAGEDGKPGAAPLLAALPFLLLSAEGTTPALTFDRSDAVTAGRVVDAGPSEVQKALSAAPRFSRPLPLALRLFPGPVSSEGEGLSVGARRVIEFEGEEAEENSVLELEVIESGPGRVEFSVAKDTTEHGGFARLRRSIVTWEPEGAGKTKVSWRLFYERNMDPAWYFDPLQRVAMRSMGDYLIEAVATP